MLIGAFSIMATPVKKAGIKLTAEMVDDVHQYRLGKLEKDIPIKTRSDFESDDAYKSYLLDSYVALRQSEYQYTVRNETMKVYDLACDGAKCTGLTDNDQVWNGYRAYINSAKTPEEKQRRQAQVNDCAIGRAPAMGSVCMNGTSGIVKGKYHCCAITSSAITAQISAKMGYDGEDNLVIAKYRGDNPGRRNNIVGAPYISHADSIQNNIKVIPEMQRTPVKNKNQPLTLNQMVKTGKLGVGDSVSLKMSEGGNTSTGCHAMVIADITKDDNGNVTSYILQANNNRRFATVNVNNSKDYFGSRKVVDCIKTNAWANAKIGSEKENLNQLSVAELEAKVVEQRGKTESVIGELAATERYNVQKGYYQGYGGGYIQLHQEAECAIRATEFHEEMKSMSLEAQKKLGGKQSFSQNKQAAMDSVVKINEMMDANKAEILIPLAVPENAKTPAELQEKPNSSDREELRASLSEARLEMADPYAIIAQYSLGENVFARTTAEPEKNPQEVLMWRMMRECQGRA